MTKKHFTPQEFAELTGYKLGTIYKFMHYGKLAYSKPNNGKAFIPFSEYERFVNPEVATQLNG